ncbi:MAG TPA: MBL fold metallo-hydrolase [Candidatus Binatia bacterium]|nr:MBL fold metallo-hydrolase [Candidatus Binatia bacterium]
MNNNPKTPAQYKNLDALGKIDLLLVTHGHGDRIADAPVLTKRNNIPLYAPGDFNMALTTLRCSRPRSCRGLIRGAGSSRYRGSRLPPRTPNTRRFTSGTTTSPTPLNPGAAVEY